MRIMTQHSLILNMRNLNRNTTLTLLRSTINIIKPSKHIPPTNPLRQHPRNRSRQRRLPMINMTHSPHIQMRLHPLKPHLTHNQTPPFLYSIDCLISM